MNKLKRIRGYPNKEFIAEMRKRDDEIKAEMQKYEAENKKRDGESKAEMPELKAKAEMRELKEIIQTEYTKFNKSLTSY